MVVCEYKLVSDVLLIDILFINVIVFCLGQEDNKVRNEIYGDVMKIMYLY